MYPIYRPLKHNMDIATAVDRYANPFEGKIDDIDDDDSSLEESIFDVDSFFLEARYSLSLSSVNESHLTEEKWQNSYGIDKSKPDIGEETDSQEGDKVKKDLSNVPYQEWAVKYINKYLVTDLLSKKSIAQWTHSSRLNEMQALPYEIRAMMKVKNYRLEPLLRLMIIRTIHERLEKVRAQLPINMKTDDKDEYLSTRLEKNFNDPKMWPKLLKRTLEAGFVGKSEISCYNPNKMSFDAKLELLQREGILYKKEDDSDSFMCPTIVINISNLKRYNGHYKLPNVKRHHADEIILFDPMVKQRMCDKLRNYRRKKAKLPRFTKQEFEQNINLSNPIISQLRNLRNPRYSRQVAGENNSCLLFNIDQIPTLEESEVRGKKTMPVPIPSSRKLFENSVDRYSFSCAHAPESHLKSRRLSCFTGTYYLGYTMNMFNDEAYKKWVFENVHFKRIAAFMYAQELSRCKKLQEEKKWPCIIYDLNILNLPFTVDGLDFIQTWLLKPRDESEKGYTNLPGLADQYKALVIEKISQDDYIRSQFLQQDLKEVEDDKDDRIVLNFIL